MVTLMLGKFFNTNWDEIAAITGLSINQVMELSDEAVESFNIKPTY